MLKNLSDRLGDAVFDHLPLILAALILALIGLCVLVGASSDAARESCLDRGAKWSCQHSGDMHCVTTNNVTTCSPDTRCWCE